MLPQHARMQTVHVLRQPPSSHLYPAAAIKLPTVPCSSHQASSCALQMLEAQQQPGKDPEVDDTAEGLIPSSRRSLSYADSASDKDLSLRTGHPRQLTAADDRAISIAPRLGAAGRDDGQQSNTHTPDLGDESLFQEALQAANGEAQLELHVPAGERRQWLSFGVPQVTSSLFFLCLHTSQAPHSLVQHT